MVLPIGSPDDSTFGIGQLSEHRPRGGAFKPRTSPYTFQGKGVEGLAMLKDAAARHGLPIVTELMDVRMLDTFRDATRIDAARTRARRVMPHRESAMDHPL